MPGPYPFGGDGFPQSRLAVPPTLCHTNPMFALLLSLAQASAGPAVPARGDLRTIFSSSDYPVGAWLLGQEGTVQAKLMVAPDGRVSECSILHSSGFAGLDSATCKLITKRAKFTPARDAKGQPTFDEVVTPPVAWRMEGNGLPVASWTIRLMVGLDKQGVPTNCAIQYGGSLDKRDQRLFECSELSGVYTVPKDLAARYAGREAVLIYDQQFVPRFLDVINAPSDLKRYPLVSKTVVRFGVDPSGMVVGCGQTSEEGSYKPAEDGCAGIRGRRFERDTKGRTGDRAATATTAIYAYVK